MRKALVAARVGVVEHCLWRRVQSLRPPSTRVGQQVLQALVTA